MSRVSEEAQYVIDNHKSMTSKEMADALGVPVVNINRILSYRGLKALSPIERIKEYIKSNTDKNRHEIAEILECAPNYIGKIATQLGITLPPRIPLEMKARVRDENRDWLTTEDGIEADKKVAEMMKNPKLRKWVKENNFDLSFIGE